MLRLEGGSFSSVMFSKSSFRFAMKFRYPCCISAILLEVPFAAFAKRPLALGFTWSKGDEGVVTERL